MSAVTLDIPITITQTLRQFLDEHPNLRYTFFGGKGGVGKTVMAGAAAVGLAQRGHRVLLASTNPVHSLSSMLDQDVFGKPTPVEGVPNLWAYEIDTRDTIERAKQDIREKISWFLKYADIKGRAEEFIEAATMNPAFEESAMFENMLEIIFKGEYDVYVFDTAPTANARRLLGMSAVYTLWVNKMIQSREEARKLRIKLSFSKEAKEEKDPLLEYLVTDGPGKDGLLLRHPARGPAHCSHPAFHQLVHRFRDSHRGRGGEHVHEPPGHPR